MFFDNFFKRRIRIVISVLTLVLIMIFFSSYIAIRSDEHRPLTVWTSTENHVEVKIDITKNPSGQLQLSGIFTPTRPGFYLYGKDLPKDGIQGLARPTLLEVIKSNSVKFIGALEADQAVKNIYVNALDISFPVYPTVPVKLSIPFELADNSNSASIELSITYMACSDITCLPPVVDKYVYIQVPEKFFNE